MYSLGWQPVIQPILASKSLKKTGRQKKEHLANVLDLKQQEREVMVSTVRSEITFFFPACVENIFRTLRCYLATALHKIMQRMRPTNRRTEAERAQSPVWAAGQEPWAHPAKLTAGWAGDSSSCDTLTLLGFLLPLTQSDGSCLGRWIQLGRWPRGPVKHPLVIVMADDVVSLRKQHGTGIWIKIQECCRRGCKCWLTRAVSGLFNYFLSIHQLRFGEFFCSVFALFKA